MRELALSALIAAIFVCFSADVLTQTKDTRQHRTIPLRPMTQDVEVLFGDPDLAGEPFVIRIRELAGGIIPPHKHPVDEHITVLQGTLYFGVGEKFDRAAMKELKAGSYAFIPKGTTMFGYTPEAAVVQVHGVGPFHIHWRAGSQWRDRLKTLDDPDAQSIFKFRKGDRVIAKRGRGCIRQGYDSGEMIGYEIEGDDGYLFAAEEKELQLAPERCINQRRNHENHK
jgi:quercetin dioxygenase-like cupin family protein